MSFLARLQITQLQRILDHKLQKSSSTPIILSSKTFNSLSSEEKCQLIFICSWRYIFFQVPWRSSFSLLQQPEINGFFLSCEISLTNILCLFSHFHCCIFFLYHYMSLIKDSLESSQTPNIERHSLNNVFQFPSSHTQEALFNNCE